MPQKKNYFFYFKIKVIAFVVLFFTCIIIGRLLYLQIYHYEEFSTRSEKNFLRMEVLHSKRGDITDCNGVSLATNRPVFDLYWEGSGKRRLTSSQEGTLLSLKKIFMPLEEDFVSKIVRAERFSQRLLLKKDIHFDALCQISEQCTTSANLVIVQHFKRSYPYYSLASHLIGYLGYSNEQKVYGKYGLERLFQNQLEGMSGYVVHVANATGKHIFQKEMKEAFHGKKIELTLDISLQQIAHTLFQEDQAGAFIVMEPQSGAIKALVSYPDFDPSLFVSSISCEEWDKLSSKNSPFLNRALHALYPPASLFKLVTFAAGLEEKIVSPQSYGVCKGYFRFCNRNYYCIKRNGHGKLFAKEFLAYSCNIPCYEIAKHISIDTLAQYAYKCGLGISTGTIMNDMDGLIPTSDWKQGVKGEPWWRGETLSASIGQSYLLVTPLQIVRMIGGIITGLLYKPRFLNEEPVLCEPLDLKEATLEFLRESMQLAVEKGTARKLKKHTDMNLYVKTGTAQTSSLDKSKTDKRFLEHGWASAYFSYKDKAPLALVVLIEKTGTSRPALKMIDCFLEKYKKLQRKQ